MEAELIEVIPVGGRDLYFRYIFLDMPNLIQDFLQPFLAFVVGNGGFQLLQSLVPAVDATPDSPLVEARHELDQRDCQRQQGDQHNLKAAGKRGGPERQYASQKWAATFEEVSCNVGQWKVDIARGREVSGPLQPVSVAVNIGGCIKKEILQSGMEITATDKGGRCAQQRMVASRQVSCGVDDALVQDLPGEETMPVLERIRARETDK